MNVLYALATEHMNAEQRLAFDVATSGDVEITKQQRIAQLLDDPDLDVVVV